MAEFSQKPSLIWKVATIFLLFLTIGLFIALIVVALEREEAKRAALAKNDQMVSECGDLNPNGNTIDLSEPSNPGPFHDLTEYEMQK
ncbi:amine oxidase, partial [Elysia marginata]